MMDGESGLSEAAGDAQPPAGAKRVKRKQAPVAAVRVPRNLDAAARQLLYETRAHQAELETRHAELLRTQEVLRERVKELHCLHGISTLMQSPGASLGDIMEGTVLLLPPAWQFPEITAARIDVDGRIFPTAQFRDTPWMMARDVMVHGRRAGAVTVCYLEERPASDEGPFLIQELRLLENIAERLGHAVERLGAEEALRASEEQYRSLFEHMAEGCAYCRVVGGGGASRDFVFLAVNAAFETLTGLADVTGRRVTEVMPEIGETDPELLDRCARVATTGEPARFEMFVHALELRISLSVYSPAPGTFVAVFDDITGRKLAEEALRESEARYRRIVEDLTDYQYAVDVEDGCAVETMHSPACVSVTGYSAEEFAADPYLWIQMVPPEDRDRVSDHARRVLAGEDVPPLEHRLVRKDGVVRWVSDTAILRRDASGRLLSYDGVIADISERRRAEEEKAGVEAQLLQAQKIEMVGRLAGGVAHDFNNMLEVILGRAEMALATTAPGEAVRTSLEEIQRAAERSAALTRQLLAFARKQPIAPRVLDLNATVVGSLTLLERLIGEDIDLYCQPGADLWPVEVDPSQIDQVLANLCINARDAITDVGEITIETANATIAADDGARPAGSPPGDYVRLAVRDNGCGMDAEAQAHLFEPFFTTKRVGEGTGLGLAMVFGIVRQNRGFVHVSSEPGHGATFAIFLPRHAGPTAPVARTDVVTGPLVSGQETVLLVEDEPAILELTTEMLEMQGYTVLAAGTPGEAIRLAAEHEGRIHLLLSDLVMPRMNGRDLARHLVSLYPHLACLFMSGYSADVAHEGLLGDDVRFLEKPFSAKSLAAKVREALESA